MAHRQRAVIAAIAAVAFSGVASAYAAQEDEPALPLSGTIEEAPEINFLPGPVDTNVKRARTQGQTEGRDPVPSRFGQPAIDEPFGAFQRGLYITAHNLAVPRAEAGDAAAQTLLAEIYSRGLGVPRDMAQASRWYELAAAQGVAEAQFHYALILLNRIENGTASSGDEALATDYMQQAAEAGKPQALFNYAQLILSERPGDTGRADAFEYFLQAAEKNVVDAQYAVAQYFANGRPPVEPDMEQAAYWMTKAAQQNYDTAQLELGQMYLSGVGLTRNLDTGFGWINRSALAGNVAARAELAKLYWAGIGTEPDSIQAGAWYVMARRAGYRDRVLEDFWEGLSEATQKQAIDEANKIR